MFDVPKTVEDAKKRRYGQWAGNSMGSSYDETRCAYAVWVGLGGMIESQCKNKNGKGVNGLYCGIHAKKVTK